MDAKFSGGIELADGETVTIPRPDEVYPVFGTVEASLDVAVQQDRIRMAEKGLETELSVAGPVRSIDDARPKATIFSGVSTTDGDDTYAEIAFETVDEIRALRDVLDLVLRYYGSED